MICFGCYCALLLGIFIPLLESEFLTSEEFDFEKSIMDSLPLFTSGDVGIESQFNIIGNLRGGSDLILGRQFKKKVMEMLFITLLHISGLAANTNPKNFAIFAGSLRHSCPQAEGIVFINSPIPSRIKTIADQYDVALVEYSPQQVKPSFLQNFHPSSLRWILFNRLLKQNGGKIKNMYQKVLFADVRDTYFQSDVFQYLPSTSGMFIAFAENLGQQIENCQWNSDWIKDCFGESLWDLVRSSRIICSGISLATMERAAEYLGMMSGILQGTSFMGHRFPKCERNGVDQGVHNVIINLGFLKSHTIHSETSFPVTHLQSSLTPPEVDYSSPPNVRISGAFTPMAVVHQFDRIHSLQLSLAQYFIKWVDVTNASALWEEEPACRRYKRVEKVDILQGKCDFGSFRAMSDEECCAKCDERLVNGRACNAFAFSDGVCYFKSCEPFELEQAQIMYKQGVLMAPTAILPDGSLGAPPGLMSAYRTTSS